MPGFRIADGDPGYRQPAPLNLQHTSPGRYPEQPGFTVVGTTEVIVSRPPVSRVRVSLASSSYSPE